VNRWTRAARAILRRRLRAWRTRLIAVFEQRAPIPTLEEAEQPLRAQLFSAEQMERHGRALARAHQCTEKRATDRLIARLADNRRVLEQARLLSTEAAQANRRITPAGEWLLDNFYLIEEQILTARRHLPKNYSRELPRLANGPSAGFPRVYDIALEAISHGDGRIDAEGLSRFVAAYQSVSPLRLGELWAIPIMLRLALIENLRRVGARLIADRTDRNLADLWGDRLTAVAEADPKSLVLVVADMARSEPPQSGPFVAELARRLQGQSSALALPLSWIEQWLGEAEQSIERMVHVENQRQAADQVSISNSIGSVRYLSTMDWREFVETMSVVEQTLREDPAGAYPRMTFASRDRYRHMVETIARRCDLNESEVARKAIELSQAEATRFADYEADDAVRDPWGAEHPSTHVGWFLIDAGLPQLQGAVAIRRPFGAAIRNQARKIPLLLYLVSIGAIVASFVFGLLRERQIGAAPHWLPWLVAALGVVAFSELGIALVNWAVTLLVGPRALPRLDFSDGIPTTARTLVVVPTMLTSVEGVDDLAESLEVRFLANRDPNLHFGLLTDFLDANEEYQPQDTGLLERATSAIDRLNQKYAPDNDDLFFLFHRPRRWNASEGAWMGYERKRGKLSALNRLLRTGSREDFSVIVGNAGALGNVRFVITLDTDTQLPRDAAREFVGTLAHPLNHAHSDPQSGRVTRGYGILQPRVGVSLGGGRLSRYAKLYGSEPGIDPYTRAVSDVYQDLFGEGSFIGKGIYEVDAFERALGERFPANRILSHDLLEGCYARAGLVSDVQLYEDYPARYAADVKRRQRWIRGDWQLLPWLLPRTLRQDGTRERNPLTLLSRGKILDNLRRSLVPAVMTTLLLLGWTLALWPLKWTAWLLSILLVPPVVASLMDLLRKPMEMPLSTHLVNVWRNSSRSIARVPITLACLPYEAFFSLDAIGRTLWRMAISHRHLLQWSPSSEVERTLGDGIGASIRRMAFAPILSAAAGGWLAWTRMDALIIAVPILALWFVSPGLMWWLGRPRERARAELAPSQNAFLGRLSRRTWMFFETFVGADDNWLPPDNVQEYPAQTIAHRTSPTNIGLALLANLAAYDFGYISAGTLLARTAATLRTLQSLPRYRGHFYNWYDTRTLAALPPHYVSTVDSGNLVGHLLTLRQGLLALIDSPILVGRIWDGLYETLDVLRESLGSNLSPTLQEFSHELDAARATPPGDSATCLRYLNALCGYAAVIERELADASGEPVAWVQALRQQCLQMLDEARMFASAPTTNGRSQWPQYLPTLHELAAGQFAADADIPLAGPEASARQRLRDIDGLVEQIGAFAQVDFNFLYDRGRHLLSIGYNFDERRLDPGYYDLLASESRLCSFIAIAQGQLPQESWFALGRQLSATDGDPVLLSWSGTMFEYLMPQLVMPSYEDTLLDQTAKASVERQIDYGSQRGVPWGISECGYNVVDAQLNYQYRAFGVPGLGLKRGLAQDLVIAPYACMLALMVSPEAACANLQRLASEKRLGRFGFYEAIDYTPARLPRGEDSVLIRSFMAHHQGMGLLALAYLLLDQPMQKRFIADPELQATLLLLQERIPRIAVFHPHAAEAAGLAPPSDVTETRLRVFSTPASLLPALQMLSNGRYHLMLTSAGSGFSKRGEMAVTRWREDPTRDSWGSWCYLRDVASGEFWSSAHQPTCVPVENYSAIFSDAKAEFRGRKLDFDSHTEIAVSPEDDIELRRLRVTNRTRVRRTIEITTCAEVVLATGISDEVQPTFSNLFVQSTLMPEKQAILCTRRPRAHDESSPWMFHLVAVHDADIDEISYETDRARFVGRGNSVARPQALSGDARLSNSEGSVLDPIVAIRCRITLDPGQTAQIDQVIGVADVHDDCVRLIDKYRDRRLADRVFDLAWTHSQVVRRQINATQADAQLYERLAGLVIYSNNALRASPAMLIQNRRGQSGLWGHAISGDLPIVLLQIADADNIELVRQIVQAHAYWRLKGLAVDLVIWNEDQAGYRQQLQDQIMGLIAAGVEANVIDRPGGIFVRPAQQMSHEDRVLLQAVARIIVSDNDGSLSDQINRRRLPEPVPAPLVPVASRIDEETAARGFEHWPFDDADERFLLDNGRGGFSIDGSEYVIRLASGENTPMPWANVLANPQFGCVVSESGVGYTWSENAHEFRLTPWPSDPVSDAAGEAYYLRDDDSGRVWSPTPLPRRGEGDYRIRHGFGYTVYEHVEDGIASTLTVHVAADVPIKFAHLHVRNLSGRQRRISATGYIEWVLGDLRTKTQPHLVTEVEPISGAILARNAYNTEFGGRVGFFAGACDGDATQRSVSGDRIEFIGRNGSLRSPAALGRERLSGRVGAGLDACAAIQIAFDLDIGGERDVVFRLGMGHDLGDAAGLAQRLHGSTFAQESLAAVRAEWQRTLGAVQVETPDPAVNVLANGWLLYQIIACRFIARSGYYQSGGAWGFRDQLQDSMAMLHAQPQRVREHLLLCAAHQFPEGDVLHWWHPPADRGVRTRISDDYLWLPLVACRYVQVTGDQRVLEEVVPYIEGRAVNADEESYYDLPMRSLRRETLYQHCVRALQRGLSLLGAHGLPLIGTGDWNDGMNRVGEGGKGETVWLGFFLYDALTQFSTVARGRQDTSFADHCMDSAEQLRQRLEQHAWDGAWYRRAWFDDGTPLGSTQSDECKIDSIAQSWSVLSGAGDPERARQAMNSLDTHLVKRDAKLVQLLDPPFDKTTHDPGYIRGYVPGVRENGGQYTHAAIWATMAFAQLGDRERAWELLRMINPLNHSRTSEEVGIYKVEPYVVAADVYAVAPHIGRGGWTWYSGSAGWMYRLIVESLLGLQREGNTLHIDPCIPIDWPSYTMRYRYGSSVYRISVAQSIAEHGELMVVLVDGAEQAERAIALVDDGREHVVEILLSSKS
jgi:cellobiose phosphorylase